MRRPAQILLFATLGLAGCDVLGSNDGSDSGSDLLTPLPPAAHVVTASATTRETPEAGLCMRWSSTVVDVSAFGDAQSVIVHGFKGGVSLATVTQESGDIMAMAVDTSGKVLGGGAITLPAEPTAGVSDVIATSDGGWLVAWLGDANYGPAGNGFAYLIRYDGSGVPVARSASVLSSSTSLVAEASGGERAVLRVEEDKVSYRLPTLAVATFPAAGGTVATSSPFGGADEGFIAYRAGILLTILTSNEPGMAIRTWDDNGALLSETSIAADAPFVDDGEYAHGTDGAGRSGYAAPQYAPGAGGTAVVYAQPNAVAFITPARNLVQPTDIVMNGATPWAEPSWGGRDHVIVGFGGRLPSASGGEDVLQIVDVSTSGARGAVGSAALAPAPFRRDFSPGVQFVATAAEDAYAVFALNPQGNADLAIFRCASRAP